MLVIIAANVAETNDQFKISKLDVCAKAVKFYVVDATADDTFEYGPSGQALANYNLNSANTESARRGHHGRRQQGVGRRRQQEGLRLRPGRQAAQAPGRPTA